MSVTALTPGIIYLVDVSDIFYFFSVRGGGRASPSRGGEGGSVFFIENPSKGGGVPGVGAGPRGREDVRGSFWGGGGLDIFFSGPKRPPSLRLFLGDSLERLK